MEAKHELGGWEAIRRIGGGGQGDVFLVRRPERAKQIEEAVATAAKNLRILPDVSHHQDNEHADATKRLLEAVAEYVRPDTAQDLGAAKRFKLGDLRPEERDEAQQRLRLEIETIAKVNSPDILRLLDSNADEGWMITEYHQQGTLDRHPGRFQCDSGAALAAFRPLVAAVAALHSQNVIHRDIKPQNVFIADNGRLVLGDFGIVFLEDDTRTRPTTSMERVGTRDWMPSWAHQGVRFENVKANFDVDCLGRLLWSMVSGKPMLQLWYWDQDTFNLERLCERDSNAHWVNSILAKAVVQWEKDCVFRSATELLEDVEGVLSSVQLGAQQIGTGVSRSCLVCGRGHYDREREELGILGLMPMDQDMSRVDATHHAFRDMQKRLTVRVFACNECGHLQFFHFPKTKPPRLWPN